MQSKSTKIFKINSFKFLFLFYFFRSVGLTLDINISYKILPKNVFVYNDILKISNEFFPSTLNLYLFFYKDTSLYITLQYGFLQVCENL